MSKYGYLEVFQRVLQLRDNESRLYLIYANISGENMRETFAELAVFGYQNGKTVNLLTSKRAR